MVIVYNEDLIRENRKKLEGFRTHYLEAFPDEEEREDFDTILNRIRLKGQHNEPDTYIALEGSSGMVAEYYTGCNCLLLTYIAVDPALRGKHVARNLILVEGVPSIKKLIYEKYSTRPAAVFFETQKPTHTNNGSFSPVTRLTIFKKLGAKYIDIPYVQPALAEGKEKSRHLLFCCFPEDNQKTLSSDVVLRFLEVFYKALGIQNPHTDPDFIGCRDELSQTTHIQLSEIPETETPAYKFEDAAIAVQVPVDHAFSTDRICRYYHSYETDLMSYQHQREKPFSTHSLNTGSPIELAFQFPEIIKFQSEGRLESLFCPHELRIRKARLYVTLTCFANHSVASFIFQPIDSFTEYDVIKLATLFGSRQENNNLKINISHNNQNDIPLDDFMDQQLRNLLSQSHLTERQTNAATTELQKLDLKGIVTGIARIRVDNSHPKQAMGELFHLMHQSDLKQPGESEDPGDSDPLEKLYHKKGMTEFLNAMCGITLGIFDFKRMDADEFIDTIRPFNSGEESFMVLNRGLLMEFWQGEISRNTTYTTGIDPYLLIPSTWLISLEYRIKRAMRILRGITDTASETLGLQLKIAEADELLQGVDESVFHYQTEQLIERKGRRERRINDLQTRAIHTLKLAKEKLDYFKYKKTQARENFIALLLLLLSSLEAAGVILGIIQSVTEGTLTKQGIFTEVITLAGMLTIAGTIFYFLKHRYDMRD